jgi:hypothetical protein
MKLTKNQLKQLIKEELQNALQAKKAAAIEWGLTGAAPPQ